MSAVAVHTEREEGGSGVPTLSPLGVLDLDAVMAVEQAAYAVPWTRGNFIDSLAVGHAAFALYSPERALLGYFVAMDGFEEMHLLNLTVSVSCQGQGLGGYLLSELVSLAERRQAREVWLEVRESNHRAQALYARHGFVAVGLRRGYYPMPAGAAAPREDAVVMSLKLTAPTSCGAPHGLE